jgi:hypothetical protein
MKVVYIAHPLSGDWEGNTASARRFAERAARTGRAPVAPYLTLDGLLHEPDDRALGLAIDLAMIPHCDELWLCGPRVTEGMRIEMETAFAYGVRVRRFSTPEEIDP